VSRRLITQAVLGAGCAAGLVWHLFVRPTAWGDPLVFQGGFRGFVVLSLVLLSAYLCVHLRASLVRARFLLLLACFALMALVVLRVSPQPEGYRWDVRYALLALMVASAWLLARAVPGVTGELAALLLLLQPGALLVLERGWMGLVAMFCLAALARVARGLRRGAAVLAPVTVPLACAAALAAWCAVLLWSGQSLSNYGWFASGVLGAAAAVPAAQEQG
jgi:hypothetical protein